MEVTDTKNRCSYIKDNGETCGAYSLINSIYCFWHDPDLTARRNHARRTGGLNRHSDSEKKRKHLHIKKEGDVQHILESLISDALRLENSIGRTRILIELLKFNERLGFYKRGRQNGQIYFQEASDVRQKLIDKINKIRENMDASKDIPASHPSNRKDDSS
ncbi:hypothetical protein ACFLWD_00710 [Chloroflexota bacterium]